MSATLTAGGACVVLCTQRTARPLHVVPSAYYLNNVYVCIYVCIYIYTSKYIYIYIYVCTFATAGSGWRAREEGIRVYHAAVCCVALISTLMLRYVSVSLPFALKKGLLTASRLSAVSLTRTNVALLRNRRHIAARDTSSVGRRGAGQHSIELTPTY